MNEPEHLPGELEELLDAEREIEAPAPDKRARMLARLGPLVIPGAIGAGVGAGVGAAAAGSGAETAATGKAAGAIGAGLKAKAVVAVIAGAVGAVGGAVTHAAFTAAPEVRSAPVATPSARVVPVPASAIAAPPPSAVTTESAAPVAAPSASAPIRAGSGTTGNLRTERLLLERATAALMRGDSSSALAALREHARKFPRGELTEEREVLLIRALRAAGDSDAAEKRAKDFKNQFPSSLQQGILDAGPSSR